MKIVSVLFLGLMITGGAYAGSIAADGKDPHHGMTGGCESKAKLAKLKELHGKNWGKQEPSAKITEEARQNKVKFQSLDKYI
ncbi:MAG: hypothetical protein OEX19_08040 [Gammaproteobacteria bacterium]|nr:hypothetical protein [Gammaproteobacteria bacterium]